MDSSSNTSDTQNASSHMGRMSADRATENGNNSISLLRFLISNATAGSVIGKGGATICELQAQSGAKIQLSRNHEYFPGTSDRVVLLSGTTNQIMAAFKLILSKIHGEAEDIESKPNQIRLVFPHLFCGAIIGKGGATIRMLMENSGAAIKLSSSEQAAPGFQDRLVSVSGNFDEQLHAVNLILNKISEDANYVQYASSYSHAGIGPHGVQPGMLHGPFGMAPAFASYAYGPLQYNDYHTKGVMAPYMAMPSAPFQLHVPHYPARSPNSFIEMHVPDECIGVILGRGGKTILDIQQSSNVRIRISERGDFVPGTTNRKVTITGTPECIQTAQQIIIQKIGQTQSVLA